MIDHYTGKWAAAVTFPSVIVLAAFSTPDDPKWVDAAHVRPSERSAGGLFDQPSVETSGDSYDVVFDDGI